MRKHSWLVVAILFAAGSAPAADFIDRCAVAGIEEIRASLAQGADPEMVRPGDTWPPNWNDAEGKPVFSTTLHRFNTDTPMATLRRDDRSAAATESLVRSLGSYISFHAAPPTGTALDGGRRLMAEFNRASILAALADMQNPGSPSFETSQGLLAGYDLDGMRPLTAAALYNRDPEVTKALIAAGAEVNSAAGDGATPLMLAAIGNTPDIVGALLDAGADIHAATRDGNMTALRLAAACNPDVAVTALLLRRGAFSKGADEQALAYAAALNPNPEVCRLLLAEGLSPVDSGMEFRSALEWAAGNNPNPDVVSLLLARTGAVDGDTMAGILEEALRSNPNIEVPRAILRRKSGWLQWNQELLVGALAHPDPERMRMVLSSGAKPDQRTITSLYHRKIGGAAPLDVLLEAAKDFPAKDYEDVLLEFVRRQDSSELILTMLKHRRLRHDEPGALDILQRILFTSTPKPEAARLFMRQGVRVNHIPDGYPEGFDPRRKLLACAVRGGQAGLARELLEEGVDPNPVSDEYKSSDPDMSENLLALAAAKAPALIPLMLEKGANPRRGHRPEKLLEIVAERCPRYREALVKAGAPTGEEAGRE